jgi:hypothetical protein
VEINSNHHHQGKKKKRDEEILKPYSYIVPFFFSWKKEDGYNNKNEII